MESRIRKRYGLPSGASDRWMIAMEVLVATLCDSANDYNGKLCLLGCFDTICAQQLPVVHPQCSLALRICFRPEDEGSHEFNIAFIDDDGGEVMPSFKPNIQVGFPKDSFFVTRNLVLNIQRLKFQNAGQYSIDVKCDDVMITRIPLRVLQAESGPAPPAPEPPSSPLD